MKRINIKPLSVNECWQGRRYKTDKYKDYQRSLLLMLPKIDVPNVKLGLDITFGFSNASSDIDNGLKPFIDILQKKYGFNDSKIYQLNVKKDKVKRGEDYVEFSIYEV